MVVVLDRLKSVETALVTYDYLQRSLRACDVATSSEYQRAFNGYYRMRQRPQTWCDLFFSILEREKRSNAVAFRWVLEEIFRESGRLEASFSSKLVATIDANSPVWDPACPGQSWIEGTVVEPRHRAAPAALRRTVFEHSVVVVESHSARRLWGVEKSVRLPVSTVPALHGHQEARPASMAVAASRGGATASVASGLPDVTADEEEHCAATAGAVHTDDTERALLAARRSRIVFAPATGFSGRNPPARRRDRATRRPGVRRGSAAPPRQPNVRHWVSWLMRYNGCQEPVVSLWSCARPSPRRRPSSCRRSPERFSRHAEDGVLHAATFGLAVSDGRVVRAVLRAASFARRGCGDPRATPRRRYRQFPSAVRCGPRRLLPSWR